MPAKSESRIPAESMGTLTWAGALGAWAGACLLFWAKAGPAKIKRANARTTKIRDILLRYPLRPAKVDPQSIETMPKGRKVTSYVIRECERNDFEAMWTIINDGARAYLGAIPPDRLRIPYMSREELDREIAAGVVFSGYEEDPELLAVMGIQEVQDVTLIRHAYVRTGSQGRGIGAELLAHLRQLTARPILIGTWADAEWAIRFYGKHGFETVSP